MRRSDIAELVALAAIWGAGFLFMRTGAPAFGPLPLVFLRVAGAALVLLPLLAWRGDVGALRRHWKEIAIVGIVNSALPFVCFMVAALVLSAGLAAIFNATAPLWAASIGWLWLGDRPTRMRTLGLVVGFAGVVALAAGNASLRPGEHGVSPAAGVLACLAATLFYGIGANYTKKRLSAVAPLAVAAGSQLAAALVLALPALWTWPAADPGASAWAGAAVLAFACTGLAYLMYFRLIANAGPTNAIAVTFLIPAFALLWGGVFLGERVTPLMAAGCAVILLGTALATGIVRARRVAATTT